MPIGRSRNVGARIAMLGSGSWLLQVFREGSAFLSLQSSTRPTSKKGACTSAKGWDAMDLGRPVGVVGGNTVSRPSTNLQRDFKPQRTNPHAEHKEG